MSDRNLSQVERELRVERIRKSKRKRQNLELLAIKRPTSIDDVRSRVPTAKNPMPEDALPEWRERSLDAKLPAIPAPDGTFIVSKGQLGEKVFIEKPKKEFDTRDPLIHETPIEYVSLHDPNLREYFQANPIVCKRLVELGMVTCEGRVICKLNEFNKYRMYLSRIHNADVAKLQQDIENWEKTEHTNIKLVTRYLKNALTHKLEEERRKRREKNVAELAEKNRLRRIKALEHPSNYLKEKRLIEAKIRKIKRDALHKNVMDRLKRIRDSERRRARHLILDWICKDEFREKLRCVIKLEKEVNRQQDRCDFVETKRAFQEKKTRYHKALLKREKIENECKVLRRSEGYLKKKKADEERALEYKRKAKEKAERVQYLMEKYGRRWLALTRKYTGNPLHSSAWHIRNILHGLVQHVKAESGAKNFSDYLKDIMKKGATKNAQIDQNTKAAVNSILDTLVERSYREFIRRATTCLVDYVVDEARKKCLSHVCEQGWDEKDLEIPICPKRQRKHIDLPKPTYPLSGPCTQYVKTGEWPCSCSQHLECLHGELCENLLKKLKKCMKRAMKCKRGGLDQLECRAKKARGSSLVCSAVQDCADIVLKRTCSQDKKQKGSCEDKPKLDDICSNLCASILGPETGPCKRRERPCGAGKPKPIVRRLEPADGTQTQTVRSVSTSAGGARKDGAMGTGPTQTSERGSAPQTRPKTDQSTVSGYQTTDSEADGAPVAPTTSKGVGGPGKTGKSVSVTPERGVDQGIGEKGPAGVEKGTAREKGVSKAAQKPPPRRLDQGTAKEPGVDSGTVGTVPTEDAGTEGVKPDVTDEETQGKAGTDEGTDVGPAQTLADAGIGSDKGEEGTQASAEAGTDVAVERSVPATEKGVGEPVPATDKGSDAPQTTTSDDGTGVEPPKDEATEKPGPKTSDDGAGKPPGEDKEVEKPNEPTSDSGTAGPASQDTETEKEAPPADESATSTDTGTDKAVDAEKKPSVDTGTKGTPGVDSGTEPDKGPVSESTAETEPAADKGSEAEPAPQDDKGLGPDSGSDKGTDAEKKPSTEEEAATEPSTDEGTEPTPKASTDDGTRTEPGTDEVTEATPAAGKDDGAGTEPGKDKATEATPKSSVEDGTSSEPVAEKSTEPPPKAAQDEEASTEPGVDKEAEATPTSKEDEAATEPGADEGTVAEPEPGDEKGTEPQPGDEKAVESEPSPGEDKDTGPEPGSDKDTEASPKPGDEKGTTSDAGDEKGTDTEVATGEEKEAGTEPGAEDSTEAKPEPGDEKDTQAEVGEDKSTAPETEPAEESGTEPDKGASEGTDTDKVPQRDTTEGTDKPDEEGLQTEKAITEDRDSEKPEEPSTEEGTEPEKPEEKGTDKEPEETGTDGTETEGGEDKGLEADIKAATESEGTDRPEESEGTEPQPTEPGTDEGVGDTETLDEGVSKPGEETEELEVGTREGTADTGSGIEGPCVCDISAICEPDPEWDEAVVSEDELLINIDELLTNVSNKMVQECIEAGVGGLDRDKQEQTETEVGCSMSAEIDKLIQGELLNLQNTCLEEQCAGLNDEERDKCLDEAIKQCLRLSDEDQKRCLAQVGKLLGPRGGETSDSDLSRTASCFVNSILTDQRTKLNTECVSVGSGDEQTVGNVFSADNVSRIASAIVKQSLCMAKFSTENPEQVGNFLPSPEVKCTVREKLQHIRSILDEVKSDLAEVGIHPMFPQSEPRLSQTRVAESEEQEPKQTDDEDS